jgi:hypothetical protein
MQVKFLADVTVKDHTGAVEFAAITGDVKELNETSAARWIKRHLAVEWKKEESPAKAEEKPSKAKAKAGA